MLKHLFYVSFLLLVVNSDVIAQDTSLFESVMKVSSGNSYGTATFINEDKDNYYAMTNYHVTGGNNVEIQCYKDGHASIWIPAKNIWNAYSPNEPKDISLISIKKSQINYRPTIINFLWNDTIYKEGDTVVTIGCPGAGWPEAFKGHITSVQGGRYYFKPEALPGRSGSVLFNEDATKAIGLIAWHDDGQGIAMTAEVIRNAVQGKRSGYYYDQPYNLKATAFKVSPDPLLEWAQCGPEGCPPRQPRQRIVPRYEQEEEYDEQYNERDDDGDKFKIFPTYPGEPDDEFTPKDEEEKPQISPAPDLTPELLEKQKKHDEKMAELDTRLGKVEEKQDNLSLDVGNLKVTQEKIDEKLNELLNKPKEEVITPGNIHEHKEKILGTIPGQLETQAKASKELKENLGNLQTSLYKDLKQVSTTVTNNTKEYVKEIVIQEKAADRNYGLVETATAPTIYGAVILILGWLYRRYFGGATSPPPFVMKAR